MFKIQTLNKIASAGLSRFPLDDYEVASEFSGPDAILVRSASLHDMDFSENLKAIGRAGAGVNNIPIEKCTDRGIVVFNTPGANANAVKELVICGMLLSSRDVVGGINWAKSLIGKGDEVPKLVEKGKSNFVWPGNPGENLGRDWPRRHRHAGGQCSLGVGHARDRLRSVHLRRFCLALVQ